MDIEFIDQKYSYENTSLVELIPTNEWNFFFKSQIKNLKKINKELTSEEKNIYPTIENVFNIFYLLPPQKIKVVIFGMSPYESVDKKTKKNNATGIAFSIPKGRKMNSSVLNFLKELKDCGYKVDLKNGNLMKLVDQGVFLCNVSLTVREGKADSHLEMYDEFTKNLMIYLNELNVVYLLWGRKAQGYKKNIKKKENVIECSHCSGLSNTKTDKPFTGSRCFLKANEKLEKLGIEEVNWDTI